MSLFIAGVAFPNQADYAAAKIAIFLASLMAGGLGMLVLWPKLDRSCDDEQEKDAELGCQTESRSMI